MYSENLLKKGTYIGKQLLFPKKSVRVIIQNLFPNEQVYIVASCNYRSIPGAVAITNRRVIYGNRILFSSDIVDIKVSDIIFATFKNKGVNKLIIETSVKKIELAALEKEAGEYILNRIIKMQKQANTATKNVLKRITTTT